MDHRTLRTAGGDLPPLPRGYTEQPATHEALPDVGALIAVMEMAEYGESTVDVASLGRDWRQAGFDLSRHTRIVLAPDGSVAAYGQAFARETPDVIEGFGPVHPKHRARGLGNWLVAWIEEHAGEQAALLEGRVRLRIVVFGSDQPARELLVSRGYQRIRSFFQMVISLDDVTPHLKDPSAINIRPFEPGRDERLVHAVLQEAFADHWAFVPRPYEEWAADRLDTAVFDPALWFVAEGGERVVGAVTSRVASAGGWIDELGVVRDWRGIGIATALLRHIFGTLRRRGLRNAMLNVDAENPTGAVRLYERVGMMVHRQWDLYEKQFAS